VSSVTTANTATVSTTTQAACDQDFPDLDNTIDDVTPVKSAVLTRKQQRRVSFATPLTTVKIFDSLQAPSAIGQWTLQPLNFFNQSHLTLTPLRAHVHRQHVKLISVDMQAGGLVVGRIAVLNISVEKLVGVHWTANQWRSTNTIDCRYESSPLPDIDVFVFSLPIIQFDAWLDGSECVLWMAIRYATDGAVYWDNHHGQNYGLRLRDVSDAMDHKDQDDWMRCAKNDLASFSTATWRDRYDIDATLGAFKSTYISYPPFGVFSLAV
jgi:hypothetical protein